MLLVKLLLLTHPCRTSVTDNMKKLLLTISIALCPLMVWAATAPTSMIRDTAGFVRPPVSTDTLAIPSIGTSGNPCLTVNSGGLISTQSCAGSGGAVTGSGFAGMMTSWSSGSAVTSTSTIIGATFIATSTKSSVFPYASTTAMTVAGLGGLYVGTLTGPLQAISGAVTATSTLSVFYGGTGANTLTGCLTGNGQGAITGSGTCNTSNASVSSVATNNGLTGGTITTTGTIGLDLTKIVNNTLLIYNGSQLQATGTPSLTSGYFIATTSIASQLPYASSTAITASGQLSVGSTTPTSNLSLSVGSTTPLALTVNNGSGYFGFGTSSPEAPFTMAVTSSLTRPDFIIDGQGTGQGAEMELNRGSNANTEGLIDFNTNGTNIWQLGLQNNSSDDFELWDGSDNPIFTIKNSTQAIGFGTTSPFGDFAINADYGDSFPGNLIFNVASSSLNATTSLLVVDNTGKVGIGTTTPGSILSIGNTKGWNFSVTGTSTSQVSNGGINLMNGGCFAIAGTCITGGGGSGSGTVNAGVAGQVAFYAANGTTVQGSSTESLTMGRYISTSTTGTNFFGGPTTVNNTLTVFGNIMSSGTLFGTGLQITGGGLMYFAGGTVINGNTDGILTLTNNAQSSFTRLNLGGTTSSFGGISTGSGNAVVITDATGGVGNRLGIGTTSPYRMLSVAGTVVAQNYEATSTLATSTFQDTVIGSGASTAFVVDYTGNAGIGTSSPYATLSVQGNTGDAFAIATSSGAGIYAIDNNGHRYSMGNKPSCDSNCTFSQGNDNDFRVITGTAKTSMTVTFAKSWGALAPICSASTGGASSVVTNASSTPTTVTLTALSVLTGQDIEVDCHGIR